MSENWKRRRGEKNCRWINKQQRRKRERERKKNQQFCCRVFGWSTKYSFNNESAMLYCIIIFEQLITVFPFFFFFFFFFSYSRIFKTTFIFLLAIGDYRFFLAESLCEKKKKKKEEVIVHKLRTLKQANWRTIGYNCCICCVSLLYAVWVFCHICRCVYSPKLFRRFSVVELSW